MQDIWLTQTKFIPPRLRDDMVPRSRLLDALHNPISSCALILLSAPAGYGKTTLLASLSNQPLTWIALDEGDNDLAGFFLAIILAFRKLDPDFGTGLQALLSSLENPAGVSRRIVSTLINEIMERFSDVWLILDDLHVITESAIHLALDYLLEHIPSSLHLIIATRHDPPLSLARLRARGELVELRAPDLRFTIEETSQFLNDKQCLGLSLEDLIKLQSRAEGWAAGLRLLAGSLDRIDSPTDRAAFISSLTLTDRYVFDFLAEEVLKRQEASTRTFLLDTSILPELTPFLCNIVAGRNDSQIFLEDLYRRNLFLSQLEETVKTFRYHTLFAEFLREQLKKESPERFVQLHRQAADVQKDSAPTRAITHYLAAELWEDAAATIERVSEQFVHQGFLKTLHTWIELLPVPVRDAHPRLLYISGMSALQQGELVDAMILLETARRGFENSDDPSLLAEVLLLMIDTASRQHDYVRQAELTMQALTISLPVHGRVQLLMAQVWQSLFQPDIHTADAALDEALQLTLSSHDLRAFNVMAPILNMHLAFLPGGPARLEHYCREVLARFGHQVGLIQAGTRSLYSYLLFLKGSLDEAAREADQALAMLDQIGGLAYSEAQAAAVQGLLAGIRGDYLAQEKLWTQALPQDERLPSLQPYLVSSLFLVGRAQWMQKKFDQARQTEARISAINDPAEFPETTMARTLMRALIEITDHKFEDAERTLQHGITLEQKWPHVVLFGSARIMLSYLYLQRKRVKEAWIQFAPFLAECEQRHMAGLILQEMIIAVPLLQLAIEKKGHVEFAKRLLDLIDVRNQPKPVSVSGTGQTLTPREVEVLKLIATGASNQAIAKQLVISEHTVKVHITNIFAKLQINSRTQAIARARELHLV